MTKKKTYKPIIVDRETYKVMKKIFGPSAGKCDIKIIEKGDDKDVLPDGRGGKENQED